MQRAHGSMKHVEQDVYVHVCGVSRGKVEVCMCVLSGSRKWHMSDHMFQPPGGQALCSSCSLHLSQILSESLSLCLFSSLSLHLSLRLSHGDLNKAV